MLAAAEHGRTAAPENSGLLARNGLERRAQIFLMIQADAHHHGDVRIDHIDGIQAAAHADLEHPCIELRRLEHQQRRQRVELEERQTHLAARGLDSLEGRHQFFARSTQRSWMTMRSR